MWTNSRVLMRLSGLILLLGALATFWQASSAWAASVIGNGQPASCSGAALAAAVASGGTITFNCGPGLQTIAVDAMVIPTGRHVTLEGDDHIALSGGDAIRPFVVQSGGELTLNHIIISHGKAAGNGGAILNQGTVTLNDSSVQESQAAGETAAGGAIFNDGGLLFANRTTILNNRAYAAAGIDNVKGTAVLKAIRIEDNIAQLYGGIASDGVLSLFDSMIRNNIAAEVSGYGGGISQVKGSMTIQGSTIISNSAPLYFGGGLAVFDGQLTMEESQILSNTSGLGGGGLFVSPTGAAEVTVRNSLIAHNATTMQNPPDNLVNTFGGGIYNNRTLHLDQVTVRENTSSLGGGLFTYSTGEMTVHNSLFTGNSAAHGGAMYLTGQQQELINVTISNNSASIDGGGILFSVGAINLTHVTIFGNASPAGANVYNNGVSVPTFANTILAAPQNSANCGFAAGSSVQSLGYNLASDNSCPLTASGDRQNAAGDAGLGPLADNGGPTLSHLPNPGSPAIDSADDTRCPAADQRGYPRPAGSSCDIGAIEAGAAPPQPTETPTPTLTPTPTPLPTATETMPISDTIPPLVHAQIDNGVAATILLDTNHGAPEQRIVVSGQAPGSATQVRISAVQESQMVGAVMAPVVNGAYTAAFIIPPDTPAGAIQLCANVAGVVNAQFDCAPLNIDAPPLVQISGALPDGFFANAPASLHLQSLNGNKEYTVDIAPDGTFVLDQVEAGKYQYAITGQIGGIVPNGLLDLVPDKENTRVDLTPSYDCLVQANPVGYLTASHTRANASLPFGIYVSGVQNVVTFEAFPQVNGPIDSVLFEIYDHDHKLVKPLELSNPPWRINFDVGSLPPSVGGRYGMIFATPIVNGKKGCPTFNAIEMIANPFPQGLFQPGGITWDGTRAYTIHATLPYVPDLLPGEFQFPPPPIPPLPYLGRYDNRLNTGIQVRGTLDLDGYVHLLLINAILEAKLMDHVLLDEGSGGITLYGPNVNLPLNDARNLNFGWLPYPIVHFEFGTPFLKAPIISFFGVLNVAVTGSVKIGGNLSIYGNLKPLVPDLDATLSATGEAGGGVGAEVNLLMGVASAGAEAGVDATLSTPLKVTVKPGGPGVKLDACLTMRFWVRAYVEALWGEKLWDKTQEVAKYPRSGESACIDVIHSAALTDDPDPSDSELMDAPAIAIAADGTQLSAYVENSAPAGQPPSIQVFARFKAPNAAEWGAPIALTNPAHSAHSPVVAFTAPEQTPLVAWAENTLTADEANALGPDISAHLRHQEIAFSTWNGSAWNAATYLTHDQLADGLPALAGSSAGAVLAWTRDLDGDAVSRDDQRIAVSIFDPANKQFGSFDLLSAPGGGLNGDVQVTYDRSALPPKPYVVWVHDGDASLVTADDRTLAVAYQDDLDWIVQNPQPLPPRVDSPSISAGADGVHLAFLVREASADGSVGLIGANGVLWTASLSGGEWQAVPLAGEKGAPVYAERPVLATQDMETLLLFRRFEQTSDNRRLGQIALSQQVGPQVFSLPLYLTDEPRENWLPALAINPLNGAASILKVARTASTATAASAGIEAGQSRLAAQPQTLSAQGAPVDALAVPAAADPALDPLTVTTTSPTPGQVVTVTATVRNLGMSVAQGITVALYKGQPGSGTLVKKVSLPDVGGLNHPTVVQLQFQASGGEESLYAELIVTGQNAGSANDRATLVLGLLSAPIMAGVIPSSQVPNGLTVVWLAAPDENASGYRILRSEAMQGPFEVVGEASLTSFTDTLVERGHPACYAVQAFSDHTLSAASAAICSGLPLVPLYLPSIRH